MNSDMDVMERLEAQERLGKIEEQNFLQEQILISMVHGTGRQLALSDHEELTNIVEAACNLADLLKEYQDI